jgi:hypothetical protein
MNDVKTDLPGESQSASGEREQAWEEIHAGSYVPIRVRGSWRGGVLG